MLFTLMQQSQKSWVSLKPASKYVPKSPGGGNAKREIVFGYDIEVHFYVEQDGSFTVTLTEKS